MITPRSAKTSTSAKTQLRSNSFASAASKTAVKAADRLQSKPKSFSSTTAPKAQIELPPLPYAKDALAPRISKETVEFHYEKHHRGYVTKINDIIKANPELQDKSLEEIVKMNGKGFNMAAQVWNHTFYWNSLSPHGGGTPTGKVGDAIKQSFGNYDTFKTKFSEAASGHFGSGWAWLVRNKDNNTLQIVQTHDAGCPIVEGHVPILTCDVWEHAYYIDYRNDRAKYIDNWWALVNWQHAEKQLK